MMASLRTRLLKLLTLLVYSLILERRIKRRRLRRHLELCAKHNEQSAIPGRSIQLPFGARIEFCCSRRFRSCPKGRSEQNKKDMHYFIVAVSRVCRKTLADSRRERWKPGRRCGIRTDLCRNGCENLARGAAVKRLARI